MLGFIKCFFCDRLNINLGITKIYKRKLSLKKFNLTTYITKKIMLTQSFQKVGVKVFEALLSFCSFIQFLLDSKVA